MLAARRNHLRAHALAAAARLDFLAIDALHMMPVVEADPDLQLQWNCDHVAKPVNPCDLYAALLRWLPEHPVRQQAA